MGRPGALDRAPGEVKSMVDFLEKVLVFIYGALVLLGIGVALSSGYFGHDYGYDEDGREIIRTP